MIDRQLNRSIDPGVLARSQIGRIDVKYLRELIKALKEVFIEYNHYMNRALLLRETV